MNELRNPEDIRRDVERSRAALGLAVEALAAKTNFKAAARHKVNDGKRLMTSLWSEHRLLVMASGVVLVLLVAKRRSERPGEDRVGE